MSDDVSNKWGLKHEWLSQCPSLCSVPSLSVILLSELQLFALMSCWDLRGREDRGGTKWMGKKVKEEEK